MALFGLETNRLKRKTWLPGELNDFAEEVFSLLSGKYPMFIDAPVRIRPSAGGTPLTIATNPSNTTSPAISIQNGGVQQTFGGNTNGDVNLTGPGQTNGNTYGGLVINGPTTGDTTFGSNDGSNVNDGDTSNDGGGGGSSSSGGGGGIDLGGVDFGGGTTVVGEAVPAPSDNPFVLYGEVVAKVSGSDYTVSLWARDPVTSPKIADVTVRLSGIHADDTADQFTPLLVLCFPTRAAGGGPTTIARAVAVPCVFFGPLS